MTTISNISQLRDADLGTSFTVESNRFERVENGLRREDGSVVPFEWFEGAVSSGRVYQGRRYEEGQWWREATGTYLYYIAHALTSPTGDDRVETLVFRAEGRYYASMDYDMGVNFGTLVTNPEDWMTNLDPVLSLYRAGRQTIAGHESVLAERDQQIADLRQQVSANGPSFNRSAFAQAMNDALDEAGVDRGSEPDMVMGEYGLPTRETDWEVQVAISGQTYLSVMEIEEQVQSARLADVDEGLYVDWTASHEFTVTAIDEDSAGDMVDRDTVQSWLNENSFDVDSFEYEVQSVSRA